MTTLPEMAHARDDDLVALTVDGTRSLTAGQWLRAAEATAARLPATRVALLHDDTDWLTHAVASLAVHMAGGTVVGLSPHLPRAELRARMERCDVAGLLHGDGIEPPPATAWTASPRTLGTLDVPGAGHPSSPAGDHIAEIIYTSGTTGTPKPVAVPQANLTFGHEGRGRLFTGVDGVLAAVPIGTNAGHSAIMTALTAPTTVHVLSRQDPTTVARAIEKLKVSMAIVAPSTATRMVALDLHRRHDLTSLKILMLGSAPVPTTTVKALTEALPATTIVLGYGSTESAPAFVSRPLPPGTSMDDHPGTSRDDHLSTPMDDHLGTPLDDHLGTPSPGTDLTVTDPAGHPVPPGELGEIRLRSAAPTRHYYQDPEATSKVWQNGWTRMGDLGHIDDQGRLHFFDRAADTLTSPDGTPVSSLRVEHAFLWHPAVAETAAFQTPEGITTAIVLRTTADPKDLKATAAHHLSPHELPTRITFVDTLPRGPLGKTLKRELRHHPSPGK